MYEPCPHRTLVPGWSRDAAAATIGLLPIRHESAAVRGAMNVKGWVLIGVLALTIIAFVTLVATPIRQAANSWAPRHPWQLGAVFGIVSGFAFGLSEGALAGLVIGGIWFLGWGWLRPWLARRRIQSASGVRQ